MNTNFATNASLDSIATDERLDEVTSLVFFEEAEYEFVGGGLAVNML